MEGEGRTPSTDLILVTQREGAPATGVTVFVPPSVYIYWCCVFRPDIYFLKPTVRVCTFHCILWNLDVNTSGSPIISLALYNGSV